MSIWPRFPMLLILLLMVCFTSILLLLGKKLLRE